MLIVASFGPEWWKRNPNEMMDWMPTESKELQIIKSCCGLGRIANGVEIPEQSF